MFVCGEGSRLKRFFKEDRYIMINKILCVLKKRGGKIWEL